MLSFFLFIGLFFIQQLAVQGFSEQVIQRGAVGDDVIELQARLQYNGYYHGRINGVYGWELFWAVKNFQHQFQLEEVDGLVGEETKEMLLKSTKFYKSFVYENLNKGTYFTHYGGVPLKIQQEPDKKFMEEMKGKFKKQIEQAQKEEQQAQQEQKTKQEQQAQQEQKTKQDQQAQQEQKTKQEQQAQQEQKAKQDQQAQQEQKAQEEQQEKDEKQTQEEENNDPVAANMPGGFSQNDIRLMANAVYGEARGEPYSGQVAVAAVILNRIDSPTFPNTVSGVIYEPGAFTAVADGQINLTPNERAMDAALDALNGWDPSENSIYYFNPNTATNSWIWGRPQVKRIGKHIFCK
ncbi:spore cortex-lytic enzyme [Bacillus carboniphilus]|uniref:Spore cortex-lytic enzyme n=2 Tax=Bacillus carboniphilus TaxID=86663 RepID=A0ABY9JY07_9BACI|nr:spore cortex-lytic enzyme [Bacillus carboniphilus]WLR44272.1 spore cortex-lytic enzyme [Bacillus carboniphilus]